MFGRFGPADQPDAVSKPPIDSFDNISKGLIWKANENLMASPTCPLLSSKL